MKLETRKYNTCNGWGFGGSFGLEATLDGWTLRKGRASTRHCGTFPICYVIPPEGRWHRDLQDTDGRRAALAAGVPQSIISAALSIKSIA